VLEGRDLHRDLASAQAQHPHGLVASSARQPRRHGLRVADGIQVVGELAPRDLGHVLDLVGRQALRAQGRQHDPPVPVDHLREGILVSRPAARHQRGQIELGVPHVTQL
jgi:hypothetical protein